jgi:hypothetical protein
MLGRLERATANHWPAAAAKNVLKSHEAVVDARDLIGYAFREYERASGTK